MDKVLQNGDTLIANPAGYNYQWYNCSTHQIIFGAVGQKFGPQISGMYAVIVYFNTGCSDTSVCTNLVLDANTVNAEAPIIIYPSLTDNYLHVIANANYFITVYNLEGKIVTQQTILKGDSLIDVSRLSSGNYILKAFNNSTLRNIRLTKK